MGTRMSEMKRTLAHARGFKTKKTRKIIRLRLILYEQQSVVQSMTIEKTLLL